MNLLHTYKKLLAAYTHENLHTITAKIIDLYKNKQYNALQKIMSIASGESDAQESQPSKAFYKLMMIYHPDRINYYVGEIEKHYHTKNAEALNRYVHIFSALDLAQTLIVLKKPSPEIESEDEYRWQDPSNRFYDDENEYDDFIDDVEPAQYGTDFYSVLKQSIYGHKNVDLPFYYLEELDSLDLSGYGIENLDGVQHCIHVSVLDLSHNEIIDIGELSQLPFLQEVFLSDNLIGYIDSLSFAKDLRIVDLSENRIDDISPLLDLQRLEYVNLLGNPAPVQQINFLRRKGIVVVF